MWLKNAALICLSANFLLLDHASDRITRHVSMRGRAVPSFPLVCMLADANLLAVCLSHAWLQAIC